MKQEELPTYCPRCKSKAIAFKGDDAWLCRSCAYYWNDKPSKEKLDMSSNSTRQGRQDPHSEESWEEDLSQLLTKYGIRFELESGKTLKQALEQYFRKEIQAERQKVIDKLGEYIQHDRDCITFSYSAGRPTKDGYEVKIAGKWYQSRPIDKTPKCNCNLDKLLDELKGRKGNENGMS